jgi:Na+-transporting NADH:ubiquinone oxidoreductase subunit NqrC
MEKKYLDDNTCESLLIVIVVVAIVKSKFVKKIRIIIKNLQIEDQRSMQKEKLILQMRTFSEELCID